MFIHLPCHERVLFDVSGGFKMLAEVRPSTSNQYLQAVKVHLYPSSNKCENFKFYCTSCGELENSDNVRVLCRRCQELFPISDILSPKDSGGLFCKSCVKYFHDETAVKLTTILSKYINLR